MKERWTDKYLGRWIAIPFYKNSIWGIMPFFNKELLPATADLERYYPIIRREVDGIMTRYDELAPFQTMSPDQEYISNDNGWRFFFLRCAGVKFKKNMALMPQTMRILSWHPEIVSAYLSILAPGKVLPPHRGPWAGVLRAHLGVIIPKSDKGVPHLIVGGFRYNWEEGKVVLFDDNYLHSAHNPTDGIRVVLFMDVIRPMRHPWDWINKAIISVIWLFPYVWIAYFRHKKWEKKFHGNT